MTSESRPTEACRDPLPPAPRGEAPRAGPPMFRRTNFVGESRRVPALAERDASRKSPVASTSRPFSAARAPADEPLRTCRVGFLGLRRSIRSPLAPVDKPRAVSPAPSQLPQPRDVHLESAFRPARRRRLGARAGRRARQSLRPVLAQSAERKQCALLARPKRAPLASREHLEPPRIETPRPSRPRPR